LQLYELLGVEGPATEKRNRAGTFQAFKLTIDGNDEIDNDGVQESSMYRPWDLPPASSSFDIC